MKGPNTNTSNAQRIADLAAAQKIVDQVNKNKGTPVSEDKNDKAKTKQSPIINEYVGEVLPNILDDYDNSTYNLKLYLMAPGEASSSTSNPSGTSSDNETSDSESDRQDQGNSGSLTSTGTGLMKV